MDHFSIHHLGNRNFSFLEGLICPNYPTQKPNIQTTTIFSHLVEISLAKSSNKNSCQCVLCDIWSNGGFFQRLSTESDIPFPVHCMVMGAKMSQAGISKPEQIKAQLSAWLDSTGGTVSEKISCFGGQKNSYHMKMG